MTEANKCCSSHLNFTIFITIRVSFCFHLSNLTEHNKTLITLAKIVVVLKALLYFCYQIRKHYLSYATNLHEIKYNKISTHSFSLFNYFTSYFLFVLFSYPASPLQHESIWTAHHITVTIYQMITTSQL